MQFNTPAPDSLLTLSPELGNGSAPAAIVVPPLQAATEVARDGGEPQDSTGALVLIVEDDPRGARLLAAHLRTAGYRATVAHSAADAQSAVERAVPDLILCDVCLPGMDGIELTRALRATPRTANVPVALITSSDDSKILSRGLEAGADDFLAKPVNALELRTRVRSLLRSKLLADELRARGQAGAPVDAPQQASDVVTEVPPQDGKPVVVIVEDSAQDRRLLEAYLVEFGFNVRFADSAAAGQELARQCRPDLIVLDLLLPDCSGYDFIASLKADPACSQVPILVVSAMSEVQDRVKALELGADDFIVKGFERLEFEARSRRLLRLKRSLDQLNTRCDQALRRAVTDSLTGLYTQGFMRETLETQLQCAARYGNPYSAIFADIDHFKQVNDRHGHAAGDAVLRSVAQALRGLMRQSDTLVRYGGEEFVALLPHTEGSEAMVLAERMRATVAALAVSVDGIPPIRVTMSLGVSSFPVDAVDGETLIQRGDAAMYLAKQSGRNRTVACASASGARLAGVRVLAVDDDDKNVRLLSAYLVSEGCELQQCHGGEAVETARREQPDVILIDCASARVGAADTCRRLKQDPYTQSLPIVMLVGPAAHDDRARGIESGADELLTKPIDKAELIVRVRAMARQKRDAELILDTESAAFAMAQAVEDRDPLVGNHMERVAEYALAFGRALGLDPSALTALWRAARVHDIGKISIPDAILFRPGKLTSEEFVIVRQHAEIGYRLLKPLRVFADVLPAVRFHHERLDGSGYPLGLRGHDVPQLAQILAVADVYDALTARRHYRAALAPAEAMELLRDEARRGLHEASLVETFIREVASRSDTAGQGTPDQRSFAQER